MKHTHTHTCDSASAHRSSCFGLKPFNGFRWFWSQDISGISLYLIGNLIFMQDACYSKMDQMLSPIIAQTQRLLSTFINYLKGIFLYEPMTRRPLLHTLTGEDISV
ncbi:MAG: hypothetical protein SH808_08395 [Saprospiraceae bacterium]|nr:hypothetical protein [Saprospiraceae bacterium]